MTSELVIDASAIMCVLLEESHKEAIIQASKGASLLAPLCLPWEIGNAFSVSFKQKRLSPTQSQEAIKIFESIPIRYVSIDLIDSVNLAAKHNIYAYDAYYLQCAKKFQKPLLTLDKKMANIGKSMGLELREMIL